MFPEVFVTSQGGSILRWGSSLARFGFCERGGAMKEGSMKEGRREGGALRQSTSGQEAFYWDAFLFLLSFSLLNLNIKLDSL